MLLEDLCGLIFKQLGHGLTLEAIKATKQTCATPLLNQASALGTDMSFMGAFSQLIIRDEFHFVLRYNSVDQKRCIT
jgi:hypothetical protein